MTAGVTLTVWQVRRCSPLALRAGSRGDAGVRAAKGLVAAILLYNVVVVSILVIAWATLVLSGMAFWPVVLGHMGLAAWWRRLLLDAEEESGPG
jgi:hypothetical protein